MSLDGLQRRVILVLLLCLGGVAWGQSPGRSVTLAYDYDWAFTLPDGREASAIPLRGFHLYKQGGTGPSHLLTTLSPDARSYRDEAVDVTQPTTYTLTAFVEQDESARSLVFILPAVTAVTAQWGDGPPPAPSPLNLLPNGDMEQAIWESRTFSGLETTLRWAAAPVHGGVRSLLTTGTAPFSLAWVAPRIPVQPRGLYDLGLWVQTTGIASGVSLHVTWTRKAPASPLWTTVQQKVQGTMPWTLLRGTLQAPAGATHARMEVRIQSLTGGTAVLDDAFMHLVTP